MKHYEFVQLWETRERRAVDANPPHDQNTFDDYPHIKPPYTEDAIDEDSEEDAIEDVYDIATREETQPQRTPL